MAEKKIKTMRDKMNDLTAPLSLESVELRIGNIKETKSFNLLAYKDSRADVNRLNEVFGSKWRPEFHHDDNSNLICSIYIYDTDIKEWIGRQGVGVPSEYEKIKGQYSDALKRAGFRWGIGTELYNMPFMYIKWQGEDKWYNKHGKMYPSGAYVKDWKLGKDEKTGLYIQTNYGEVVWQQKGTKKKRQSNYSQTKSKSSGKKSKSKRNLPDIFSRMNKIPLGFEEGTRWKKGKTKNIQWIAENIKSEAGNRAKKELEVRDVLRRVKSSFKKNEVVSAKEQVGITKLNDVNNLKQAKKLLELLESEPKEEDAADEDDFLF